MTKNADFGPNLAVFGPKSLIFMGLSKSFGTNITENHFGNLSALFFGHALDQVGQKCWYLAQNASFVTVEEAEETIVSYDTTDIIFFALNSYIEYLI